jgi:putative tryptophan/tyrosine transport system substrate-binding protein
MKRRQFIAGLGGAAAWPLVARAQQATVPAVGYLYAGSPETSTYLVAAFHKGLSEMGYVEGRNVAIEYRWAHNDYSRLPELAADLVRHQVAVIAVPGVQLAVAAAKAATATIPIVFTMTGDPVQSGLVASLNRPGGNVTGFTNMTTELMPKQLALLHELLPAAVRFAVLVDPEDPDAQSTVKALQAAASDIGRQIEAFYASTEREIDAAFTNIVQNRADALLVSPLVFFSNRRAQLATLAIHHQVPTIYSIREFAEAGGLMSYGPSLTNQLRQAGIYTSRILKGEKPANLPVQRPTKFELVINLKTAKALGLTISPNLLAIADEVIE